MTTLETINDVRRTEVEHGVTCSGIGRAKALAAVMETAKQSCLNNGAKHVVVTFGRSQGTLMIFEWQTDEAVARDFGKKNRK